MREDDDERQRDALWRGHGDNAPPAKAPAEAARFSGFYGGVGAYETVRDALMQRARHVLWREAMVGRSRPVTGKARLKTEELHARLARLHTEIGACAKAASPLLKAPRRTTEVRTLDKQVKAAAKVLALDRSLRMQDGTARRQLLILWEVIDDSLDGVALMVAQISATIDPEARLDLLTPEEIEAIYGGKPFAHKPDLQRRVANLAILQRLDAGLRASLSEVRALLAGRFGGPDNLNGPPEKRRGRWLAAHLLGMATGLGETPTRGDGMGKGSACDMVVALKEFLSLEMKNTKAPDPAVGAMLAEFPDGYHGMRKIWLARKSDPLVERAVDDGRRLGERLLKRL